MFHFNEPKWPPLYQIVNTVLKKYDLQVSITSAKPIKQ